MSSEPFSQPRCLTCDYSLTSLPEPRCPECGRPFDPADPHTVNLTGRPFPALARFLAKPVGLPLYLLALTAFTWPLWEYRKPNNNFSAPLLGVLLWLIVIVACVAKFLTRISIHHAYARPNAEYRLGRYRGLGILALWVLYVLIPADLLVRAAFHLSRPGLERLAHDALAQPDTVTGPHVAGLYQPVPDGLLPNGGIRLQTGHAYEVSPVGFAYSPNGSPPRHRLGWLRAPRRPLVHLLAKPGRPSTPRYPPHLLPQVIKETVQKPNFCLDRPPPAEYAYR